MRQITVRGITPDLGRRLRHMSEARNESLNTMVLGILRRAAGIEERKQALARYATWTEKDLREFEGALRAQRVIDVDLWK